ncbi:hypothetical protein GCM10011297_04460 [Bacterioplanes sanyensis]|uniref:glutaredoxin family protein n=1 Tax=Bacterioplanes sanyensis TaxID=1249553 RepID=UPI00167AF653|nr:glutaredoxin domain-containing protein [Bacterioplanes sanyensis]GGY34529.1 hypothetical protein GCM10011297_04460 [Bacterioplanes sanyensis]
MKLALHYYDACPFCQMVLRVLPQIDTEVELRNVLSNPDYRQEQQQATGRTTVPCLRLEDDQGQVQWLYESMDIVEYLKAL